ncbi:MAG: hypothetical protein LW693_06305 [Saprospiraceae bacterium]|nr:hypothetical protein [Saprospiraceae bacterium]
MKKRETPLRAGIKCRCAGSANGWASQAYNRLFTGEVKTGYSGRGTLDFRLRTKNKFGRKKKLADRTFVHRVTLVVEVMFTSVAVCGSTRGMILVCMMMLKQGVQRLHQPEADKETQECAGGEALIRM